MGARPLRRAIQRYIEDPLADEVLKAGVDAIQPGTTVMVDRDESGDENDQPLSLTLIAPKKGPAKKDEEKQPVAVGAEGSSEDESGDEPGEPADSSDE